MQRFIAVITSFIIFSSCTNKTESELIIFKAADEGLQSSNKAIFNASKVLYQALEQKFLRPETAVQASIWQPKALLIKEKSFEMTGYLDSLIIELKKEADLRMVDMKEVYNEGDLDAAGSLFTNKNTGEELFEKLQKYKKDILAVDPGMKKEFGDNSIIISYRFEDVRNSKDFTKAFFDHVPAIAALAILRKFENNVRVLENQLIQYCFNQIGSTDGCGFYRKLSAIVSQSSNIIKAGDQMEIQAGIGAFSSTSKPIITINGKIFKPENEAIASYKFKTSFITGKYIVPVKIEFINESGMKQTIERKIEYTVVE